MLLLREIERRGVGFLHDLQTDRGVAQSACKHIDRALRLRDELERLVRHAELRRLQMLRRHPLSKRQHQQVEKIKRDGFLRIGRQRRSIGKPQSQIETRILPKPGFAQIRRGDADILKGRQQLAIVEQRDLRRGRCRERFLQQASHKRADFLPRPGRSGPIAHHGLSAA